MGRSWLCPPAAALTVARNWASSSGKLAVYSSFIMYMYSGHLVKVLSVPISLRVERGRQADNTATI